MDVREFQIAELKSQIKKKNLRMKHLEEEKRLAKEKMNLFEKLHDDLYEKHARLERQFEANFKFHKYIKDVLDQTANLMKEI